ncbi:AraC family transcriptional regulator [Ferruginibacter sp. SUN106]|uniref:AraC family transcriptional regulator n=1 Tax=Ferruginibacter sp. SUN106 TaxID=2978348 RepID=UPI003D367CA9
MNQFFLQQGNSKELHPFAHIIEFGIRRNNTVQLNSFTETSTNSIRIYYVLEGKFEWIINDHQHILYPGDLVLIQPGHKFGGQKGVLDIGKLCSLYIEVNKAEPADRIMFGKWTSLPKNEILAIGKILRLCNTPVLSRVKEAGRILTEIRNEIFNQQIGYSTRVNQLLDELFILIARKLTLQNNTHRDFPQSFMNLENALRQNLSHNWSVEEMAAMVGLGTTTFTEKVKSYSGFSPLNYLITIRISEAIKLLKQNDLSVTDIALDTGFYSSQHFSTTFKKLTGYTPSDFRKKNISNEQD